MRKGLAFLTLGASIVLGSTSIAYAAHPQADPAHAGNPATLTTLAPPQAGEGHRSPDGGGRAHRLHQIQKFDAAAESRAPTFPFLPSITAKIAAPSLITGGTWTPLGPTPVADEKNIGLTPATTSDYGRASGRVTGLATSPSNPSIIYLGASGGGVWKSSDGGASWTTTTDSQPSIAIGSLAVDAAGTTIYAALGEDNASGDSQRGLGILKSVDSGATWTAVGQSTFAQLRIGGIVVDRNTSGGTERVFAATNAGLFVSTNSGATWSQVSLTITPIPGKTVSPHVMQVLQDSTGRFWIAVSDFCQTELGDVMTSLNGTLWTSTFPTPVAGTGRVALGISPTGSVAYAALATCANFGDVLGIWRTVDSATTWTQTAAPPQYFSIPNVTPLQSQGWYDNVVAVDPTNSNNAVFGGITVIATGDGGAHFSDIGLSYLGGVIHPDHHALLFTGANTFYDGNDGGIWQGNETLGATTVSASWTNLNANLNTIQFYRGAALDTNHVLGGSQDNGSPGIFPGSPAVGPAWQEYLDGDGGYSAIDPTSGSTTIYASTSSGQIWKGSTAPPGSPDPNWPYDTFVEADPCPAAGGFTACNDPVAFIQPTLMDQTNPARLLTGRNRLYQSTSGGLPAGSGWLAISPVLATATPPAGAPSDVIASMTMGSTVATAGTVWTGSFFGAVWRSSNATSVSAMWANATGNLPPFNLSAHVPGDPWISGIAVNPTNTSEAWVTIGGIGVGHVWHTTNGGTSWADISGTGVTGVPDAVVNDVVLDRSDNTTLYIATDFGVLVCVTCTGATPTATWSAVGTGLPNVKVDSITQTQLANQVVAWTHGRGAWVVPTAPVLGVSPSSMTFTVGPGGAKPGTQTATVANVGLGTLTWSQTSNAAWLSALPASGSLVAGASTPLTVSVNTTGLAAGTRNGTLTFTSNGGSATINVSLVIPVFPGQYKPLVPFRILDTRNGTGGFTTPVGQNQSIAVQVAGQGTVPSMASPTPPSAVVMNATVTNPTIPSYLTIYPTGVTRPLASNLNFLPQQTVPNLVEVALGPDGKVNVYNGGGSVDVILDVAGWVTTQGTGSGTDGLFRPLVPARILDTRIGTGGFSSPVGPGQTIHLQVANAGGVPSTTSATPPEAVVMNVTVTNPTVASYLTIFPTGASRPVISNLNFLPGQTVPNRVEVKLGTSGQVDIFNAGGTVDVIADVNGWFTDGSDPTATGGMTSGLTPARILDTRYGTGGFNTPLGPGGKIFLPVAGFGGVPAMAAAVPPTAVILNVTVTNVTAASNLRLFPSDAPTQPPNSSDLNYVAGQTVPNFVVVKLGADGKVGIYNYAGSTDVVVDILGWFN